ncbi:MAG: hypothetical protein Q9216_001238 [Gyalolechia sp. 2 TL-2023]
MVITIKFTDKLLISLAKVEEELWALVRRQEIDAYVNRTFRQAVPKDNVIWFKNWKALKSIHSVEHFHVMLFDPDPEFVKEVTHGDVPLSRKA